MPNSMKITFDNDLDGVFMPNQQICGSVELQVDEKINKAKGLCVVIEGIGFSEWGFKSYGAEPRVGHFKETEMFINFESYLLGSKGNKENIEIPVGSHVYQFSCQLPPDLPSTARAAGNIEGHIRYRARAILEFSWTTDLKAEIPFKIINEVDLNKFPELRLPCEQEMLKTFCCLFCKSNPLVLKVRLPKTGFALGEQIPVNVEIVNGSRTEVFFTALSLIKVNTFNAQARTKILREEVLSMRCKGVDPGDSTEIQEFFEISSDLAVSNNRYSKVYQITYEIEVFAETAGASVSPTLSTPIVIGNVALNN